MEHSGSAVSAANLISSNKATESSRNTHWMWTIPLSTGICCDAKLKIISPAIRVIEPCTDVSTEGKTNTAQHIYCGFTTLHQIHFVCLWLCEIDDCFIFCNLHSLLTLHFHLFHYFPVSQPHLNSADYTFLNDHSWGLQIQKPFGWLGPSGLPYITNHMHHYQHARRTLILMNIKAMKMSSKTASCVICCLCVLVCVRAWKKEPFYQTCTFVILDSSCTDSQHSLSVWLTNCCKKLLSSQVSIFSKNHTSPLWIIFIFKNSFLTINLIVYQKYR